MDPSVVIRFANRFEAVAAEALGDEGHLAPVGALVGEARAEPGLAEGVAFALGIMIDAIGQSDPTGRFALKIRVLTEARDALLAR